MFYTFNNFEYFLVWPSFRVQVLLRGLLCPEWNKLAIRCQAAPRWAASECLLTKLYKLLVFTWPKNIAITSNMHLLSHNSRQSLSVPSHFTTKTFFLSQRFAKKCSAGLTLGLLFSGPILLICVCKLVLGRDFTILPPLLLGCILQ